MVRITLVLTALVLLAMPPGASAQAVPEDLEPFVGEWERHGFFLTIADDGSTAASWRVYQWCGPGVPEPCDRVVNNVRLVAGGRGEIVFSAVDADGMHGEVVWSTQPDFLVPGVVTLSLLPHGMAALRQERQELVLCSPDFEPETEQEIEERYAGCGA